MTKKEVMEAARKQIQQGNFKAAAKLINDRADARRKQTTFGIGKNR